MTKKILLSLLFLLGALFIAAGWWFKAAASEKKNNVVATVGSSIITVDDIQEVLKRIPPFNRKRYATKTGKVELLDKLIEEELLYQEALRKGLDKDDEYRRRVDKIRHGILASMVKKGLWENSKDKMDASVMQMREKANVKVNYGIITGVMATVGNASISTDDLNDALKSMPPYMLERYSTKPGRAELLDKLVEEELFYQEALHRGLDKDEEFNRRMDQIRRGLLASSAKMKLLEKDIPVTEKEIKDYYDQNPELFKQKPFDEVAKNIERHIQQQKLREKYDILLMQLREKANVHVNEDILDSIQVDLGPENQPGMPDQPESNGLFEP